MTTSAGQSAAWATMLRPASDRQTRTRGTSGGNGRAVISSPTVADTRCVLAPSGFGQRGVESAAGRRQQRGERHRRGVEHHQHAEPREPVRGDQAGHLVDPARGLVSVHGDENLDRNHDDLLGSNVSFPGAGRTRGRARRTIDARNPTVSAARYWHEARGRSRAGLRAPVPDRTSDGGILRSERRAAGRAGDDATESGRVGRCALVTDCAGAGQTGQRSVRARHAGRPGDTDSRRPRRRPRARWAWPARPCRRPRRPEHDEDRPQRVHRRTQSTIGRHRSISG